MKIKPSGFLLFAWIAVSAATANAQTYSRTEVITYHDNTSKWVLGQVASVKCMDSIPASAACDGDMVSETVFDSTNALPIQAKAFTLVQQSFSYDTTASVASGQRGTLKTVADGNGNVTNLGSWKRGIPQIITFPATTDQPTAETQTAAVDNNGWVTSVTDENGYKTCYAYDAMGRVANITYPSETQNGVCSTSAWNATTRTFEQISASEYGIEPGHWRQTVLTGTGRKLTYFDALWRPLIVREDDTTQITATRRVTRHAYDQQGRLAFTSYPVADGTPPAIGTHTTYDALGRATEVRQNSEIGDLVTDIEYLSGFRTRVTNPRNFATTTSYMAYDEPMTDWPMLIDAPEGTYTHFKRDPYGKPTMIRRSNSSNPAGGTVALSRTYVYGGAQRPCIITEPETGSTVVQYDDATNLFRQTGGLAIAAGTSCKAAKNIALASGRMVTRSYDARNRLKAIVFPDHLGDTSYTYTPDSQLASLTADNGGTAQVATQYTYNRRRMMTGERLLWDTINWPVTYVYNRNGHLSAQQWHGVNITYAPNALGQPTQAGTYASTVAYHPNGAIKSFTYGNNIHHTLDQNTRGLPDRSRDVYGGTTFLDDGYDYDPNGNVAAISDGTSGHDGDRTMAYDELDRLTGTIAPDMFGTATYAYDVLDNLTRVNLTGGNQIRDHYYCYDAKWHLTNIKTGGCVGGATVMGLGYDLQGNLFKRSDKTFTFDYGNRLRTVSGPTTKYVYDGHGRRVRDFTGEGKYSQYSHRGELVMESDRRKGTVTEYISLQGSLVATRERDTTTNAYTVKYQHTDALGSPVAITAQNRTVLEKRKYEPFGRQISPAPQDGPAFTGHLYDAATGMVYMQQRYYDDDIGRFLSVDPVTAYEKPMTNFNRYIYALNNPYRLTDPDGRNGVTAFGGVLQESWNAINGRGFDGASVWGALKDGYNGEGDGIARSAFDDAMAFIPWGKVTKIGALGGVLKDAARAAPGGALTSEIRSAGRAITGMIREAGGAVESTVKGSRVATMDVRIGQGAAENVLADAGFAAKTTRDGRSSFTNGNIRFTFRGSPQNGPTISVAVGGREVLKIRMKE